MKKLSICKPDQERTEAGNCVKKCLTNQVRVPVTKRKPFKRRKSFERAIRKTKTM